MDLITTWATVIIALIALILSIVSGIYSRVHNKLSVRPYLTIHQYFAPPQELRVTNKGNGPAIIKCIYICIDDNSFKNPTREAWDLILSTLDIKGAIFHIADS